MSGCCGGLVETWSAAWPVPQVVELPTAITTHTPSLLTTTGHGYTHSILGSKWAVNVYTTFQELRPYAFMTNLFFLLIGRWFPGLFNLYTPRICLCFSCLGNRGILGDVEFPLIFAADKLFHSTAEGGGGGGGGGGLGHWVIEGKRGRVRALGHCGEEGEG